MKVLIDGDIVAYRVGYTTDKDDVGIALWRCDTTMHGILQGTGSTSQETFLTDSPNNFRLKLFPAYKANRKQAKPRWLEDLKEHLITEWGAKITPEQEADDALGIAQTNARKPVLGSFYEDGEVFSFKQEETIIASNDKDLLQIPGMHYNIPTGLIVEQQPFSGLNWFYQQLLIGDVTDNVSGVRGIGKIWAERLLAHCLSEWEMFKVVQDLYKNDERLLLTGRLLKIRQKENELWEFPIEAAISKSEGQDVPTTSEGPNP